MNRRRRPFVPLCALVGIPLLAVGAPAQEAAGPLPPAESLARFKVPDDLELDLVLAEPDVRQPVSFQFDERGRMWVVEYLQYPDPAGLTVLSRDNFWRAQYDKVPPPPPGHFVGADRIVIHEDTDGDGRYDHQKVFLEGLSIVTSVARGRGGVWVLNPPYLLFYHDRDQDDVPDGDPEVHLAGFGLEDTHSCANSLCWGPDGWLYAAQGSTVTGAVVRPGLDEKPFHSMGQLIWRYHPETRRYEIFAEGGGNAFGVEFDSRGRLFSGHNGGDTRGFHYVQGGYSQKGFAKHGPLSNPYAFGYFPPMRHPSVPRFTHTFVIYEGGALPPAYDGELFGVAPLLFHVVQSHLAREGSSFQTTDVGHPITTDDPWFRPVDIKVGPDGALYVADFYEAQIAHLRHHDGLIDKSNGRIYRLRARGAGPLAPFDLSAKTTAELVETLAHPNKWFRTTALRLLADRRDRSALPAVRELLVAPAGPRSLDALWALNACGGLDEGTQLALLDHPDPFVRLWTVRLACDDRRASPELLARMIALAGAETDVEVRSQLACSARRLPTADCLALVRPLLAHAEDTTDIHLPLLLWWAIEAKCAGDPAAVQGLFEDRSLWDERLVQDHILSRAMRRFAATESRTDLLVCARLLALAPDAARQKILLTGFEEAFQGRSLSNLPDELVAALAAAGGGSLPLRLRQGQPAAIDEALRLVADASAPVAERLECVRAFAEVTHPQCVPVLLGVVRDSGDDGLRAAAATALLRYEDPAIAPAVVASLPELPKDVAAAAYSLLSSRPAWAVELLEAVDAERIDRLAIPIEAVRKMQRYAQPRIDEIVAAHWGEIRSETTEEMRAQVQRLLSAVGGSAGSPYAGKKLFTETCAKCHTLFGAGGRIGPDLTTYKRDDLENMLIHIVNPSAEIREGFENFLVVTGDGRSLGGFLADQDDQVVVLRGADGQNVTLARDEIEEIAPNRLSLMPEGLLKPFDDQQVRDLFAYLRSTQPLNE